MKSPTQRTLELLRKEGWVPAVVEKWNQYARIRQDVYGFGDILAYRWLTCEIALIQCTSASNISARRKKILAEKRAREWCLSGGQIILIGWSQRGKRGEKKKWTPTCEWITYRMLAGEVEV